MNHIFGNLKRRCEMHVQENGGEFKSRQCEAIIKVLSEELEKLQNQIKDLRNGKDV